MEYRALKSFAGAVSMRRNEVKEIKDQEVVKQLLRGGLIEEVGGDKPKTTKSSAKPAKTKKGGES
jgi:hypothetical protein